MSKLATIIVGLLVVVLTVGIGARWLFVPESAAGDMGIALSNPLSFSTARGDMGGAFLALGILTALGLGRREPRYLEAVAIAIAAVIGGRLVSLLLDGFDALAIGAIGSEAVFLAALVVTVRKMNETPGL